MDSQQSTDGQQHSALQPDLVPEIKSAKRVFWRYVRGALGFTVAVNLLLLVAPMYMLQIYDRVLTSGSVETLIVLTFIAVFLLLMYVAAEGGRKRVLANAGKEFGETLDRVSLRAGFHNSRMPPAAIIQNVGNLSRAQSFLINGTISPMLDAPFAPLFLLILFAIHWSLGVFGLAGAIVLLGIALFTDSTSKKSVEDAAQQENAAQTMLAHTVRQRAAIVSMGMGDRIIDRWQEKRQGAITESLRSVNSSNFLSATSRSFRQILQVGILGAAAALALQQLISPGAIIAASIIMGRGLAPIDQAVGMWRQMIRAQQSWLDLKKYVAAGMTSEMLKEGEKVTKMPRPSPILKLEEFSVAAPGAQKPLLPKLTFELQRGAIVALLGPSGSGKTSLMQTLAGAWLPAHGTARLGNRDIHTWNSEDRGRYVGYLPQHVELLTGSVFENISRFTDPDTDLVYEAARRAGCHDVILGLPEGYDTQIGEHGAHLSAGQRQSVGLARAFFDNPVMMLLDEPTAHLDSTMVGAFLQQIARLSKIPEADRDSLYIIATHDVRIINAADRVLVIQNGKVGLMPRDEYLRKISDLNQKRAQLNPPSQGGTGPGQND